MALNRSVERALRLDAGCGRAALKVACGAALANLVLHTDVFDIVFFSKTRFRFSALAAYLPPWLAWFLPLPKWISNIPGTPSCADAVTVAALGPFPELNDHNAIVASTPLPCTLRGKVPGAKYWSVQVFFPATEKVAANTMVCDREIPIEADGTYALEISDSRPADPRVAWIDAGGAPRAKLIVIRAFCVPPGTAWRAPAVRPGTAVDGLAAAPWRITGTERTAGPCASWHASGPAHRFAKILAANAAAASAATSWAAIAAGALAALAARTLLLRAVAKGTRKRLRARELTPNTAFVLPEARASLGGAARHSYFTAIYDCTRGDVAVRGVRAGAFRYTSVTCYEFNALPLPQYYDDATLAPDADGGDAYAVVLTTAPTRAKGRNEIDVSACPVGVVVVRLVYPESPEVLESARPTITAL